MSDLENRIVGPLQENCRTSTRELRLLIDISGCLLLSNSFCMMLVVFWADVVLEDGIGLLNLGVATHFDRMGLLNAKSHKVSIREMWKIIKPQ